MQHRIELLSELFSRLNSLKTLDQRRDAMQAYIDADERQKMGLRVFVECVFHSGISFGIPFGPLPPAPEGVEEMSRDEELKQSYDVYANDFIGARKSLFPFIEQSTAYIKNELIRERDFVNLAKSMHPLERDILMAAKDKTMPPVRAVTENLFRHEMFEAWVPGISTKEDTK